MSFDLKKLVPALTAGLVCGIIAVIYAIAFPALIFTKDLAVYLPYGIGIAMFSACVYAGVVALLSSYRGMIGDVQDAPSVIMGLAVNGVASSVGLSVLHPRSFATIMATITITTLATGLFLYLIGQFRLGSLVRFIPYPVIGGFLAGSGWLITKSSISVMANVGLDNLSKLFEASNVILWLPGVALAIALIIIFRYTNHFLVLPGVLIGSIAIFYLVLAITGTPIAKASAMGFLLGELSSGGLWQLPKFELFLQADWGAIFSQIGAIAAVLLVSLIGLLLNSSALELALERDIDLNKELRASGIANLLSALGGGLIGFQTLSSSVLPKRLGGESRLAGLVTSAICLIALLIGGNFLSFFPKFVLGGLLLFLGLEFLIEWAIKAGRTLPRLDYAIVLLILVVIGAIGFLEGVAVGILVALILFALDYSRVRVIKHALSGQSYRSYVDRPVEHQEILNRLGDEIYILELQGFIFFGTANALLDQIRARVQEKDPRFIILDYRQVIGLDSSAVLSFIRLQQLARAKNFLLIFTHLSERLEKLLMRGGLNFAELKIFSELNLGVEWSENEILQRENIDLTASSRSLLVEHPDLIKDIDDSKFLSYFERLELPANHYLMKQGDVPNEVYFLEKGQINVQVEMRTGQTIRLRKMGPGAVVGEIELYLGTTRGASVITTEPSVVYRLRVESLQQMGQDIPGFAAYIHQFMARLMAERLINTNRTVEALMR